MRYRPAQYQICPICTDADIGDDSGWINCRYVKERMRQRLTAVSREALELYLSGKGLREVAAEIGYSHERARQFIAEAYRYLEMSEVMWELGYAPATSPGDDDASSPSNAPDSSATRRAVGRPRCRSAD